MELGENWQLIGVSEQHEAPKEWHIPKSTWLRWLELPRRRPQPRAGSTLSGTLSPGLASPASLTRWDWSAGVLLYVGRTRAGATAHAWRLGTANFWSLPAFVPLPSPSTSTPLPSFLTGLDSGTDTASPTSLPFQPQAEENFGISRSKGKKRNSW